MRSCIGPRDRVGEAELSPARQIQLGVSAGVTCGLIQRASPWIHGSISRNDNLKRTQGLGPGMDITAVSTSFTGVEYNHVDMSDKNTQRPTGGKGLDGSP